MNAEACTTCRGLLNGQADDDGQAVRVEEAHPECECESYSVGLNTPGPVQKAETLYRLIVSPAGVDWEKQMLVGEATLGKVSENGVSVFRDSASDEDVANLVIDRLSRRPDQKPRTVQAIAKLLVEPVHELRDIGVNGRVFCIYDETVPRKYERDQPPVPTHVTILQRLLPPGTANRKALAKQGQTPLIRLVEAGLLHLDEFRSALIVNLNERSLGGDFVIQPHDGC